MRRQKIVECFLFELALAPLVLLAIEATRIIFFGAPAELWHRPAWFLCTLQVVAIVCYSAHVIANARLDEKESGLWIFQLLLYQQVAMFRYWVSHVWGQPLKLRT